MDESNLPLGAPVPAFSATPPHRMDLEGNYVRLTPLQAKADVSELFAVSHGSAETERLWTYMSHGPFAGAAQMESWLAEIERSTDPLFFTVCDKLRGKKVGMLSFLNIVPEMLRLEIGHIWYAPQAQRTPINTEALYLMLRHAFEELQYRRVEWKCDSLNERSCRAALRLGFEFEGVFKEHMVAKGRNRDTSWYAMLSKHWPGIKKNMETWLLDGAEKRLSLGVMNQALRDHKSPA